MDTDHAKNWDELKQRAHTELNPYWYGVIDSLVHQLEDAQGEIERLKQIQTVVVQDGPLVAAYKNAQSQLTAEREKFTTHTKAVEQFLSDLYCTMIDPLVEGNMEVAETMKALLEQAQKDRESLSQLTAANAETERLRGELNLVADCLEGKAPSHLAFFDHPHAHNARSLVSQLTAERESKLAARGEVDRLRKQLGTQVGMVEKLRKAVIGLIKLRAETDHTYESAYQAMFKNMGSTEWAAAEQALADNGQSND